MKKKEYSEPEEPPGEGHKSETALAHGTAGGWRRENVQKHRRGDGYKWYNMIDGLQCQGKLKSKY